MYLSHCGSKLQDQSWKRTKINDFTPPTFSYSLRGWLVLCVCVFWFFVFVFMLRAKGFPLPWIFSPGPSISGQTIPGWCLAWTSKQESQGVNDTGIVLWGLISSEAVKSLWKGLPLGWSCCLCPGKPYVVLLSSVELCPFWMLSDVSDIPRIQSGGEEEVVNFWWIGKSSKKGSRIINVKYGSKYIKFLH